jgi:hypothetical protein
VAIARKSGMPAERVINTLGHEEFGRWLQNRKERAMRPAAVRTASDRWSQPKN